MELERSESAPPEKTSSAIKAGEEMLNRKLENATYSNKLQCSERNNNLQNYENGWTIIANDKKKLLIIYSFNSPSLALAPHTRYVFTV